MNWLDILLLTAVAAALALAVRSCHSRRKKGGCCGSSCSGSCPGCGKCGRPSR